MRFIRVFPQTAYTGLIISIQKKWQFVQCVTPMFRNLFALLGVSLRDNFLPSLIGVRREEITYALLNRAT